MGLGEGYKGLYPFLAARRGVWREIARYVHRDAGPADSVVELGAGYCDFINQFPAGRRIAFDLNPEMRRYARPDVDFRVEDATTLRGIEEESIDLVFASNLLEHLAMQDVHTMLDSVRRVLRRGGRLVLIQPNYRLCEDRYFDDPTHRTIFSDRILRDVLQANALAVVKLEAGLLPFSMRSRVPKWPLLVRLYLRSPIRPLAAQMYAVAEKG